MEARWQLWKPVFAMQLGKDLVDLVEVHVLFGLDVPKSLVEKLLHLLSLVFFPHIETFLLEKGIDHIQVCFMLLLSL